MPSDRRYTVEGYWDCQYCGRTGIRGRFKSCPGCGHGRDASVRFYTMEIDEAHAITHEEFERQTAEADKNSHSDSANYTHASIIDAAVPSLFDRDEGEGRGGESDAHDASDWYCDYCDSYNPDTASFCRNCGAARDQSSGKTYAQTMGTMARTYDAQGNLVKERDLSARHKEKPDSAKHISAKPVKKKPGCLRFVLIGGLLLVFAAIVMALVLPTTKDITVDGFDWEQTIAIEQLQTVDESDWSLPSGGRLERKSEEIRSYNRVLDHYETVEYEVSEQVVDHYDTYTTTVDNGDGTFDVEEHSKPVYTTEYHTETREEPVYVSVPVFDTKYYYKIERWVHERDVTTSGTDHDPYWGEPNLSDATGAHGTGEEREASRTGTYGVTDSEGKHYTADEDFWRSLEKGQTITVEVRGDHITPKE